MVDFINQIKGNFFAQSVFRDNTRDQKKNRSTAAIVHLEERHHLVRQASARNVKQENTAKLKEAWRVLTVRLGSTLLLVTVRTPVYYK